MKKMKYFALILCVSFTSVIMFNTMLISTVSLSVANIKIIFMVCSLISLLCVVMDQIPIIKDYPMIYSFIIVISIAMGFQYLYDSTVLTHSFVYYILILIGTYLIVWGCIYINDYKDIQKLNQKLKDGY